MKIEELFLTRRWYREGEVFIHTQLYKDDNCYVYEVKRDNGNAKWYEVFKRKVVPKLIVKDDKLSSSKDEFKVKYPGNNDFGYWAFCVPDYDSGKKDDISSAMYCVNKWANEAK